MSMSTKTYTRKEAVRILLNNGYELVRKNQGHDLYKKGNDTIALPNRLNKMLFQGEIKRHNLEVDYDRKTGKAARKRK